MRLVLREEKTTVTKASTDPSVSSASVNALPAVWLYTGFVDMRKSIYGLLTHIKEVMSADPQSRQLYLFLNKRKNRLKGVLWDSNGFLMIYKVLEKNRFHLPQTPDSDRYALTAEEFQWLLGGLDVETMRKNTHLNFSDYS